MSFYEESEQEREERAAAQIEKWEAAAFDRLRKERDALRAEVERLREAARQVHALAEKGTGDWPGHTAFYALTAIHKITKGMVPSDADH